MNNILDKWNTEDEAICQYVNKNNQILITKDQDFRNSFLLRKTPKKLIKINLGNISNADLFNVIERYIDTLKSLNQENDSFMVEINKSSFWMVTR